MVQSPTVMGSEFSVEFSYNEIEEEFKNLIEANKIIHNKTMFD